MSLVRLLGFTTLALRLRGRPLSRSRDEPRSRLRRGKRKCLRQSWPPAEPHRATERCGRRRSLALTSKASVIRAFPALRFAIRPCSFVTRLQPDTTAVMSILKPHELLDTGAARPLLPRRLPRRLRAAANRTASTSSSPRRPTTSASSTTATRTRCRPAEYLEWTDDVGRRGGAGAAARRLAVPERRRASRAIRGRRSTSRRRRARTCGCRTSFTGSSRSPSTAHPPAPPPG